METDEAENPEQMLLRMAAGDCSALLFFVKILMDGSYKIPPREALVAAECFASLAASSGSPEARSALASVLVCRSEELRRDDPERAERMWWMAAHEMFELAALGDKVAAASLMEGLSVRADEGDEEAAVTLNDVVAVLPPETLSAAREFHEQALAAPLVGIAKQCSQ